MLLASSPCGGGHVHTVQAHGFGDGVAVRIKRVEVHYQQHKTSVRKLYREEHLPLHMYVCRCRGRRRDHDATWNRLVTVTRASLL